MSILVSLLLQVLHIGLMIVAAPLVAGVLDWLEARFAGRSGPPLLLPWRLLIRLSRKIPVELDSGSVVLRFAPAIELGATVSAAALVPSFATSMALSPLADILVVVSLLIIARVAGVLAALDAGAALPGLAAQQSSALAVPAEAALIMAIFALALMGGSFNLGLIILAQDDGGLVPATAAFVALASLLALAAADEAASGSALDQVLTGTGLAVSRMAGWLRRLVWIDLIGALAFPFGLATFPAGPLDWAIGFTCWALKLAIFVLCLSGLQTLLGRMPARRRQGLTAVALLLALVAVVLVLTSTRLA
jgi:formate hydrogenlyase subunit 4